MPVTLADLARLFNIQGFSWRDLIGQDRWESWIPVRVNWTDVGTPTVVARYRTVGKWCQAQVRITPSTSIETVSGTSYMSLPVPPGGIAGGGTVFDFTAGMPLGTCGVSVSNSRLYMPTIGTTASVIEFEFSYEIA